MSLSTILIFIFILIIDVVLITIDIKNKLIFAGRNKYRIIMPVMIVIFMVSTFVSKSFKFEDIVVLIEILPLAFVGNKCGITSKGLLTNSFVTTWDKIENYSLDENNDKYILRYKTNIGEKRIVFKIQDKEEVKKYLLGIRKLKYIKK